MNKLERYTELILNFFPSGLAWQKDQGSVLHKLSSVIAPEFTKVDDAAKRLILEADPRTTWDLLTDWESMLGLPDSCTHSSNSDKPTLEDRRRIVLQKLTTGGGSNEDFFRQVCSQMGYNGIKVRSFYPYRMGTARMGDRFTNHGWEYVFEVQSPNSLDRQFRMGQSRMGERLKQFGNPALECTIKKLKPAHTTVIFNFGTGEI